MSEKNRRVALRYFLEPLLSLSAIRSLYLRLRNAVDRWACTRFLARLNDYDPLTVRRLRFALENNLTLQEVIDLEDEGIQQLAALIVEQHDERKSSEQED